MLAGAAGNLIDRVRLGGVTDFFDVGFCPVFNVADSAISVGVGLLALRMMLTPAAPSDRATVVVTMGSRGREALLRRGFDSRPFRRSPPFSLGPEWERRKIGAAEEQRGAGRAEDLAGRTGAAQALGQHDGVILRRHVLPNALNSLIVIATIELANMMTKIGQVEEALRAKGQGVA